MAQKMYDASGASTAEIIASTADRTKIYGIMAVGLAVGSTIELRVGTGGVWSTGDTVLVWEASAAEVGNAKVVFPEGSEFFAGGGSNLLADATGDWLILTHT